ncbi:MAG: plasmid mobilization relaxosome protein MobC [Clostridia bacterium]|nr:plasmid mobilization relaxosome protein MobC [Clostridia bacterium]MBO6269510.1 plasmid mobilization relaxosome protein MobC [Clostridium sp.]
MEKRDIRITFRVSSSELERIRRKMAELGTENVSAYARKMTLDGLCVNLDLSEVRELVSLLRRCSNNLNQYAKRANQTGRIYQEDIEDLKRQFDEFWKIGKELLVRLASIR